MLNPMEIQNKEFKKSFRGYCEEEVNDFMMQIANDYEIVFRDNREMKEVIEQLREKIAHYEKMESTMTSTLMMAQETAENLKAAARMEADLIKQAAEQEKQALIRDTEQALRDGQERYERIRQDVAVFRAKMESLLNSHQKLLQEMELPECRDCIVETGNFEPPYVTPVVVAENEAPTEPVEFDHMQVASEDMEEPVEALEETTKADVERA